MHTMIDRQTRDIVTRTWIIHTGFSMLQRDIALDLAVQSRTLHYALCIRRSTLWGKKLHPFIFGITFSNRTVFG